MPHRGLHIFGRPLPLVLMAAYKTIWGVGELCFGTLLIFSSALIRGELFEDPSDRFIDWLLNGLHFNLNTAEKIGVLLLIYGTIKIVVAIGIWIGSWEVRKYLLIVLSLITIFALADLQTGFGLFKLVTLVADVVILVYLWKYLPKHLRAKD